jgi:hypothetical protein
MLENLKIATTARNPLYRAVLSVVKILHHLRKHTRCEQQRYHQVPIKKIDLILKWQGTKVLKRVKQGNPIAILTTKNNLFNDAA